jgi:3-hydroxyisobutyrate dehydrogenase-like beta-hydroxyacid dehydrogenase
MGVDPAVLFSTLAKGSADSFGLRNHGMKAVLPQEFPLRSFSVRYAKKDLAYGLVLAAQASVPADTAQRIDALFDAAISQGFGEQYWPVVSRFIGN